MLLWHVIYNLTIGIMKLDKLNINEAIEKAEALLKQEKKISLALKTTLSLLIAIVKIFLQKMSVNSNNSSQPPASDKNRNRGSKNQKSKRKKGGQNGHEGARLETAKNPDKVEWIKIDRRSLPRGHYKDVGFESRQVVDIKISRIVTEYRAEVLEDSHGVKYVARFPEFVKTDIQYGASVKAHSVYMSQEQLIPYARIQAYFDEKAQIPLSAGSLFNFNQEAYALLEGFDRIAKVKLLEEKVLHADETGISVDKKTIWLHTATSKLWTYFYPHEKRGREAMDAIGILPKFEGTLCHDHWKPYFTYSCRHGLCNAHHVRELRFAEEEDKQHWAGKMKELLLEINDRVNKSQSNKLSQKLCKIYRKKYRKIISLGEKECPLPNKLKGSPKRGRIKKSKSRNLLERLSNFEDSVLLFMEDSLVPFTNNISENDLRMTKVQQKISGCFRSMEGALIFCRVRSYLLTCQKHNVKMTDALNLLFLGKLPDFLISQ